MCLFKEYSQKKVPGTWDFDLTSNINYARLTFEIPGGHQMAKYVTFAFLAKLNEIETFIGSTKMIFNLINQMDDDWYSFACLGGVLFLNSQLYIECSQVMKKRL